MGFWTGQLLLWSGFIAAAFVSVRQQEFAEDKWSTVEWPWYVGAMVVGAIGAVMIRKSKAASEQSSSKVEAQYSVLETQLNVLRQAVSELRTMCDHVAPSQMVKLIDDRCAEPFAEFADSRNALVQRFGLQGFADVMTQFASGERFVNRAWSASADGYMDEVSRSLERADFHLQSASEKLGVLDRQFAANPAVAAAESKPLDGRDSDEENERYFDERNF